MKKLLSGLMVGLAVMAVNPGVAKAHGDGWATVGKVLTGVVAAQLLLGNGSACSQPVYQEVRYYSPPVVYSPPPVVYTQPQVVYSQPQVVYVQPQVVTYCPPPVVQYCPPPVVVNPCPVVVFRGGYGWRGGHDGGRGERRDYDGGRRGGSHEQWRR